MAPTVKRKQLPQLSISCLSWVPLPMPVHPHTEISQERQEENSKSGGRDSQTNMTTMPRRRQAIIETDAKTGSWRKGSRFWGPGGVWGGAFGEVRIAYVSVWRSEIKWLVSGISCKSTVGGEGMSQESQWQPPGQRAVNVTCESEPDPEPLICKQPEAFEVFPRWVCELEMSRNRSLPQREGQFRVQCQDFPHSWTIWNVECGWEAGPPTHFGCWLSQGWGVWPSVCSNISFQIWKQLARLGTLWSSGTLS